jgi:hypothetical protein
MLHNQDRDISSEPPFTQAPWLAEYFSFIVEITLIAFQAASIWPLQREFDLSSTSLFVYSLNLR